MGAHLYWVTRGYQFGDTQGRWGVAVDIARYFPSYRRLIPELTKDLNTGPLVTRPYPHDRIGERTETFVRFTTPPGTNGAGTVGWFGPSERPVEGFVMLVKRGIDPDILHGNIQLPDDDKALANVILKQAEIPPPSGDLDWPPLQ